MRPAGRALLRKLGETNGRSIPLMDRAYEGDETRQLALDLNFIPAVPPKGNRVSAWDYDREMYKRRNEIDRLFRPLEGFRRIFSRSEKLDMMFIAFIHFRLIIEALRRLLTRPSFGNRATGDFESVECFCSPVDRFGG
jgi:hypothetical protein